MNTSDDNQYPDYADTGSVSALSGPPSSLRSSPELETAQPQFTARSQSKKGFTTPHKSPLVQEQEEEEAKAARDAKEKKTQKKKALVKPSKPQKTEKQKEREEQARLDAKEAAKEAAKAKKRAEKLNEIRTLLHKGPQAPAPWPLQLPNLPPRQNTSGRNFPLKLLKKDPTFPLTDATRDESITIVLDAMRDCRGAEDNCSLTTSFWYMWLKPSVEGKYEYDELDMERVCRKLVNIAEALHAHGLGATDIYCRRTIEKAMAAHPMSFKKRIEKLAMLMRKSKSRCNDFMLGNTLEDTIALIDIKLSDQKSNAANNRMRSLKVDQSNQLLGFAKGEKWPKDQNGKPILFIEPPAPGYGTPESMGPDGGKNKHDEPAEEDAMQHAEDFQQPYIADQGLVRYEKGLQGQAPDRPLLYPHHYQPPNDMEYIESMPPLQRLAYNGSGADTSTTISTGFGNSGFEDTHDHALQAGVPHGNFQQLPVEPRPFAPIFPSQMEPSFNGFVDGFLAYGPRGVNNTVIQGSQVPAPRFARPPIAHQYPELDASLLNDNWETMFENHHGYPVHDPSLEVQQTFVAYQAEDETPEIDLPRAREYPTFDRIKRAAQDVDALETGGEEDEEVPEPTTKHIRRGEAGAGFSEQPHEVSMNSVQRGHTA